MDPTLTITTGILYSMDREDIFEWDPNKAARNRMSMVLALKMLKMHFVILMPLIFLTSVSTMEKTVTI